MNERAGHLLRGFCSVFVMWLPESRHLAPITRDGPAARGAAEFFQALYAELDGARTSAEAEFILSAVESRAKRQQELERAAFAARTRAADTAVKLMRRGQTLALALGLSVLAFSLAAAFSDRDGVGIAVVILWNVVVVSALVMGARLRSGERNRRASV